MAAWDDVREIALALPETDERPSRGHAFWRIKDKGFVWERPLHGSDLKALGEAAPQGPLVLLERIDLDELREIMSRRGSAGLPGVWPSPISPRNSTTRRADGSFRRR